MHIIFKKSNVHFLSVFFLLLFATFLPSHANECILVKLTSTPQGLLKKTTVDEITGLKGFDTWVKSSGISNVSPAFSAQSFGTNSNSISRWVKIDLPDGADKDRFLAAVQQQPDVEYAQQNRVFKLDFVPNDPLQNQQWALEKINAFDAWDIERGSSYVLIAIIDTGIDYEHADVRQNIWINDGEDLNHNNVIDADDYNGIDDDSNGFVDDIQGWDFADAPNYPDGGDYMQRDNDPLDEHGHGTGVAGIIGGVTDNGIGVAGLAHFCRLMNLRAFTAGGNGEEDDVASAILYAIANGARVINMSWGDVFVSRILDDVIQYAEEKGVIMVASAGNSATDQIHYPSGFSGTISVGATNENDQLAGFSNYGPTVDLVAPGSEIFTTTLNDEYTSFSGTSFSAPYVSAVAALLLSRDESLGAEAIRGLLARSCVDLGNQGWDTLYGAGRLDVFRALSQPLYSIVKIDAPQLDKGFSNGPIVIQGSAWSPTFESYTLYYGSGDNPDEWFEIGPTQHIRVLDGFLGTWDSLPDLDGAYTIRLTVKSRNGAIEEAFVRIFIDRTAPVITQVELLPMVDGEFYSTLVQFQTDDLCEGSVFYKPSGSVEPFNEAVAAFRTTEVRLNMTPSLSQDILDVKVEARNGAGLATQENNNGQYYQVDLGQPLIDKNRFVPTQLTVFSGHLLNKVFDYNENGFPELVVGTLQQGTLGLLKLYEYDGLNMSELFAFPTPLIPRDIGDSDNDGKLEMLCGLGFSSYLYESNQKGEFPSIQSQVWEGDGTQQYWASRITDLDQDGRGEVVLRVVKSEGGANVDQFEVWESSGNNTYAFKAAFLNPTYGSNQNGVPHCEVGDFDGDGLLEILMGDSDGDIYLYENNGDDNYRQTWQDNLPLLDSIDYLSVGDYDGDGLLEFIAGCHSDPNLNTEHYYDARHWYYRLYDNNGNDTYEMAAEWRFFGFESPKDFESGVSSGDIDQDGMDEILVCVFPDFYVIDYTETDSYDIVYHAENIESNAAIVVDVNNDGQTEFWLGNGEETKSYIGAGNLAAPQVPTGLSAQPLDSKNILLTWRSVSGADEYEIYRGKTQSNVELLATTSDNEFQDTTVEKDNIYWYSIVTVDAEKSPSKSSFSMPVSARPGLQPFLLKAEAESPSSVRLYFSEPLNETAKNTSNYVFSDDIGHPTSAVIDKSGQEIVLSLAKLMVLNKTYFVQGFHLQDVDRTPLDTTRNEASFVVSGTPVFPYLVDGRLISSSQIELLFNEPMESFSVQNVANYDLGEFATVQSADLHESDPARVILTISSAQSFGALGKSYPVRVINLKSAQGQTMQAGRGDYIEFIFSRQNLDDVFTYPNPFRPGLGEDRITFANLTEKAEIVILSTGGKLVRRLNEEDGNGGVNWDLRDEEGNMVSSGIYIYKASGNGFTKLGKFAVIR